VRVRPLFAAVGLLIAGILAEPFVPGAPLVHFALALVCLLLGLVSLQRFALVLLLPFYFLGVGRTRLARLPSPLTAKAGHYVTLVGTVAASPETTRWGGARFPVDTGQGRVLVQCPLPFAGYAGDRVQVRGTLREPQAATNPGEFDYRALLLRQGVGLELRTRAVERLPHEGRESAPEWVRRRIQTACFSHLPETDAALLSGLLISDRSRLPAALNDAFQRTGTVHILSTSGLHLSLLAFLAASLLARLLPRARWLAVLLALLLIAVYALAAGGGGAVTRSAVMVGVFLLAPLVRREPEPLHSLALAVLLILLSSPLALFDAGTQLSVVTVWTLLSWWKTVERLIWPWEVGLSRVSRALRWLVLAFSAGLVAQLGSSGLVAYHFNLISWIAPLANIPITALAELLLVLGLAAVVWGGILWWGVGLGLQLLKVLALGFASVPFPATSTVAPPVLLLVLGYACLLLPAPYIRLWVQRARFRPL